MKFVILGSLGRLWGPLQYFYNLGVCASQVLSTILGGDPDETVSSRTGKAIVRGQWFAVNISGPFLDFLFMESNHALKSIEEDEGDKEIWTWGGRY